MFLSVVLIVRQALAGAWLAHPPLRNVVSEEIEAENRNLNGMAGARRHLDHEITTASSTAPLENRLAGFKFEMARVAVQPSMVTPRGIKIVAHCASLWQAFGVVDTVDPTFTSGVM
jgi:hypothetical protein